MTKVNEVLLNMLNNVNGLKVAMHNLGCKVNGYEMNVDYEFEKKNEKMDKKIFNKKIQKKIMFSEFEN